MLRFQVKRRLVSFPSVQKVNKTDLYLGTLHWFMTLKTFEK